MTEHPEEQSLLMRVIIAALIVCMIALALSACYTSKQFKPKKFKTARGVEMISA